MNIQAWSKHQKVERTSPGSKNPYKITFHDGTQKWTDDYPGDGKGGRREHRKEERKQRRPSVKDDRVKLDSYLKRFVDGELDAAGLSKVVDDIVVHLDRELARETIGKWLKAQPEGEGKVKEGLEIIRQRKIDKLRDKKAMSDRVDRIASDLVASGVTDAIVSEIKSIWRTLSIAVKRAYGSSFSFSSVYAKNSLEVVMKFDGIEEEGVSVGANVKWDYVEDAYIVTPFAANGTNVHWGKSVGGMLLDDLANIAKMTHIFEEVQPPFEIRAAIMASRVASRAFASERTVEEIEREIQFYKNSAADNKSRSDLASKGSHNKDKYLWDARRDTEKVRELQRELKGIK